VTSIITIHCTKVIVLLRHSIFIHLNKFIRHCEHVLFTNYARSPLSGATVHAGITITRLLRILVRDIKDINTLEKRHSHVTVLSVNRP
jgi:hypothetical protein